VQQLLFRAEHGFVNIFCASAPKGGPGSATAVETILPTRRNVVESRAAGNTASRAASRVTQKIRAIRLAGKKKCAQDRNRGGAQESLVDSSEAETPGDPKRIWGLANGLQRSPLSRTDLPSLCSQSS
jgi:hypothetical protein